MFTFTPSKEQDIILGNMMNTMGKLQEIKQKTDEAKEQLNDVFLEESTADGSIRVIITASRGTKSVSINDTLLEDRKALENFLVLMLNKVIAKATERNGATLAAITKQGLPFSF